MSGPPREWDRSCERIARQVAGGFFIPGADDDDVVQEARIGVWRSMRDWRPGAGSEWPSFARFCANRQLITALIASQRMKHRALNESVSMDAPIGRSADVIPMRPIALTGGRDPLALALGHEEWEALVEAWQDLAVLEREAMVRVRIGGEPYTDVGPQKRVDNALQRGERKLRAALIRIERRAA